MIVLEGMRKAAVLELQKSGWGDKTHKQMEREIAIEEVEDKFPRSDIDDKSYVNLEKRERKRPPRRGRETFHDPFPALSSSVSP